MILETMVIALRNGFTEEAKELGKTAEKLMHRISTHDYTEEDQSRARVDKILASSKSS